MNYLLLPPIAFLIVLCVVSFQAYMMKKVAAQGKDSNGKTKAYACGEAGCEHHIQPDYKQFFSFAFFFTIMHVVVLVIATVPSDFISSVLAGIYVLSAIVGLLILFRR
ncbi:MAG: hypothetical protein WCQ47_09055 [bacterium]